MPRRARRQIHPIVRLASAMRVAALRINNESFRKQAERDADSLPKCNLERGGGRKGEMARLGRAVLSTLNQIAPEQYAEKAEVLRGCADAVMSDFKETSSVELGKRSRRVA